MDSAEQGTGRRYIPYVTDDPKSLFRSNKNFSRIDRRGDLMTFRLRT